MLASRGFVVAIFLGVLVFAAYSPVRAGVFVWDDHVLIENDARCAMRLAQCFDQAYFPPSPFLEVRSVYYRPLTTISFRTLTTMMALGGEAAPQHLFNVGLHALNAVLLLIVARRVGLGVARASAIAISWALFPRLVEAVGWVSGRTDVLATTFVLFAIAVFPRQAPQYTARHFTLMGFSSVALFFGLLAKETASAGFLTVAALAMVRAERRRTGIYRAVLVSAVPLLAYTLMRLRAIKGELPSRDVDVGTTALTVVEALGRYVAMAVRFWSPWTFTGAVGKTSVAFVVLGLVTLAALVVGAKRIVRTHRDALVAGTTLAMAALFPVLHVVPLGLHGALTADRLLYLPLAGALLAIAAAVPRLGKATWPVAAVVAACATLGFFGTRAAASLFRDELALWITLAERADDANTGPRTALAAVVRDRGHAPLACKIWEGVRRELDASGRRGTVTRRRATENLAACLSRTNRHDESLALYRELATEYPDAARIALGVGYAELHVMHFEAARTNFRRASDLDPSLARLADDLLAESALAAREQSAALAPDASPAMKARFYARVGRSDDAERSWLAIALDPKESTILHREAIGYLVRDGSLAAAEKAFDANAQDKAIDGPLQGRLATKRELFDSVKAEEARIARLVR